ncbi:hypothetical protein BDQ17DRAFT_1208774, partial [Cyathus striatus]
CHPRTRGIAIGSIFKWIFENNTEKIYWLCGPMGVGKSTIIQTIAVKLDEIGRLGASFFFHPLDPSRNNVSKLFSTISYQLAISSGSQSFRQAIENEINHDPSLVHRSINVQWTKLIVQPLMKCINELKGMNVIIDGLDECDREQVQAVLKLFDNGDLEMLLRIIL